MEWLYHYIGDTMLTSDSLAGLEGAVPRLLQYLQEKGWAVTSHKIPGPSLSVRFLGVVWLGKTKVIPEAVIDKVQAFPTPTLWQYYKSFWVFWLLESVYSALGANSAALTLAGTKGHQVGQE